MAELKLKLGLNGHDENLTNGNSGIAIVALLMHGYHTNMLVMAAHCVYMLPSVRRTPCSGRQETFDLLITTGLTS